MEKAENIEKHFFWRTKSAPILSENLSDKKVKIGELVELSIAGIWLKTS